eukprot:6560255-Pyramimonas_sp.AAC.1
MAILELHVRDVARETTNRKWREPYVHKSSSSSNKTIRSDLMTHMATHIFMFSHGSLGATLFSVQRAAPAAASRP